MKKISAVLALFFLTFSIYSQSVWTGNASVGGSSDFPGKSDVFRAASNSFPVGTVLRVTNPRGGAEVDVTVSSRLEVPGVFILVEESAAVFIGLPSDHVLPVRVTPISSSTSTELKIYREESGELTEDTDYNPAASLKTDVDGISEKVEDLPVEKNEVKAEETLVETEDESETIITYDLSRENSELKPESEKVDSDENKIYFLVPSDLRPPEADDESELKTAPSPASSLDIDLSHYVSDSRMRYIQLGAFRNKAVMEDTARGIGEIAPGYPLSVDVSLVKTETVYKLLIGPLTPAELGIVLKTARSGAFPDAFSYSP